MIYPIRIGDINHLAIYLDITIRIIIFAAVIAAKFFLINEAK